MAEPVAPALDTANRAYKIGGISVEFPYKAYGSQLAYMGKVVATLERSHRMMMQQQPQQPRSHCHALLESPTGTGKSLALLCATLAWQKHFQASLASQAAGVPASVPQALVTQASLPQAAVPLSSPPPGDVFVNGGGFVVEASAPELEQAQQRPGKGGKQTAKKPKVPTIFYATRTHSQITQVLREFRKTNYRVPMAVLASRKHYCTNKYVCKKKNVDEECKLLLKEEDRACPQFKNVHKVKNHSSLKKGGFHEVHDIEDLVSIGYSVKGCAYFAARSMASEAQIVFCPYSYILNPMIRKAMEINVQGAIIVLDEAHNIEDIAREAGSMDLEISVLEAMRVELEQLSALGPTMDFYQPLQEMVQEMLGWLHQQVNNLEKQDFEHYCSSWTGDRALQALQAAGISLQCFPILLECANKAIVVASDPEAETSHLSGVFASALEGEAFKILLDCWN